MALKINKELLFSHSNQFDETTRKQTKTKLIKKLKMAVENSKTKRKKRLKKLKENLEKEEKMWEEEKREEKSNHGGIIVHTTTQIIYT